MNIKYRFNRILGSGLWWQFFTFALANVLVFSICMVIYFCVRHQTDIGLWDSLRLFVNSNSILDDHDPNTDKANVVLLITECLGTILFSSLIVSLITNVIGLKVEAIKEGHVHYKLNGHVVIIGYDAIVPSIISEFIADPLHKKCKIVLQSSGDIEEIRNTLLTKLKASEMNRVVLIHAPRQSVEELKLLYTHLAREILIVGDRTQSDHDAENMYTFEVLVDIHKEWGNKTSTKPLRIWFENEASYAALRLNDIDEEWKKYFQFRPYNFYKRWANRLLTSSEYGKDEKRIVYPELDHQGIKKDSKKHVHLIIVGMNRMGIALAKEAAHILHFPNFDEETGKNRTRITFIDDNADREMNFFMGRLPGYFKIAPSKYADLSRWGFHGFKENTLTEDGELVKNFLDVQFEFIKGRVESPQVRDWLCGEMKDSNAIISIAICIENPSKSFGMALYLPEEVYLRGRSNPEKLWEVEDEDQVVNVFVRQEKTGSLIKTFGNSAKSAKASNKRYANIYPFGMVDESFMLDYNSNRLAMAFNYIYKFYCDYNQTLPSSIPSDEELVKLWKQLPISHQWSNLYLADSIEFKLRSIGLNENTVRYADITTEQIEQLAYTEHCRWNMEKLLLGYRPLKTEEKDLDKDKQKELKNKMYAHQLIKPYKALLPEEKELDRNIIKELPTILRMLNNKQ